MSAEDELKQRALAAAELIEEIAADLKTMAVLDEDLRIRLVTAAGQLSRPDRYSRKALGKALARARFRANREADRALLDQAGIRALRREPVFRTPLPKPEWTKLDAPLRDDEGDDAWAQAEARREEPTTDTPRVESARMCYVCKRDFHELHHFYDQMCPPCAEENFKKRDQTADLRGRVALITGARVKIGYQAAVKLLRAGADVIVATRFPRDAARRFGTEPDASEWTARLHIYGIDLRHTPSVELFAHHLLATQSRLDALINNACQTVRRPAGWYDHVVAGEDAPPENAFERAVLDRNRALRGDGLALARAGGQEIQAVGLWRSAVLSQVPLLAEDLERGGHLYPDGKLDQDLQQVDQRDFNSWRMTLAEVPTAFVAV